MTFHGKSAGWSWGLFCCVVLAAWSGSTGCNSRPKAGHDGSRDGRFTQVTPGVIFDTKTGLIWSDHDNGGSLDWYAAGRYCASNTTGGFSDWRLPTQQELLTLYDGGHTNSDGFCLTGLIRLTGQNVWTMDVPTGSVLERDAPRAIYISFSDHFPGGQPLMTYKAEKDGGMLPAWPNLRALPVRGKLH